MIPTRAPLIGFLKPPHKTPPGFTAQGREPIILTSRMHNLPVLAFNRTSHSFVALATGDFTGSLSTLTYATSLFIGHSRIYFETLRDDPNRTKHREEDYLSSPLYNWTPPRLSFALTFDSDLHWLNINHNLMIVRAHVLDLTRKNAAEKISTLYRLTTWITEAPRAYCDTFGIEPDPAWPTAPEDWAVHFGLDTAFARMIGRKLRKEA